MSMIVGGKVERIMNGFRKNGENVYFGTVSDQTIIVNGGGWRNVEHFERKLEKSLKFVKCQICSKINVHDCLKS